MGDDSESWWRTPDATLAAYEKMEGKVDKYLAFFQSLVASNHQFTFTLNIGKDNAFSFSTYDLSHDLKKAAPKPQSRKDRRASNPAAAALAGQAAASAPVQSPTARPEMGGVAGLSPLPAKEVKCEQREHEQPVAGHPGRRDQGVWRQLCQRRPHS